MLNPEDPNDVSHIIAAAMLGTYGEKWTNATQEARQAMVEAHIGGENKAMGPRFCLDTERYIALHSAACAREIRLNAEHDRHTYTTEQEIENSMRKLLKDAGIQPVDSLIEWRENH